MVSPLLSCRPLHAKLVVFSPEAAEAEFSIFQLPINYCFENLQSSQENLKTIVYGKFGGQTRCIMGNWKIENVVHKWIKLYFAIDFERFEDDGFVFQNRNKPVPKCTCSLMPFFTLRVPLIFSVFPFWIWLGICFSFARCHFVFWLQNTEILATSMLSSSMRDGLVILVLTI